VRTQPTNLDEGALPVVRLGLYQDRNGNWFASVEQREGRGMSMTWTATYTTPREAMEAGWALTRFGGHVEPEQGKK
jgi:enoyl-CoA hydratase/carnithine racemase